jgi:oligopeptide transport system substrate-binding protein
VHLPTLAKHGDPYQRNNRWTRPGNFVGNGPFVLTKWSVGQVIAVKKNPLYWNAANVKLSAIHFHPIESSDTEERSFRSGQLHVTGDVPLSKIPIYRKEKAHLLRIDPYLGAYFYRINTTRPQFKDKRVRQALAMAVDRKAIVERITRGGQLPAFYFTPPDTVGTPRARRCATTPRRARAARGRRLSGRQGLPRVRHPLQHVRGAQVDRRGDPADVEARARHRRAAAEPGVEGLPRHREAPRLPGLARRLDRRLSGSVDVPRDVPSDSGNNRTGWKNAEYDRLLKEAARLGDQKTRYELFQKAEAIFLDELPIIPIYHYTRVYLIQPSVRGWHPTILDHHPWQHVWLTAPPERIAAAKP